jgi:membrane protease YdiL (CAAX protease family)
MMEQNVFMLLATAVLGALAILFAIIGVATRAWPIGTIALFNCGNQCDYRHTAAGVLLIIAIVALAIASILTIMFLRRLISHFSDRIKAFVLSLIVLSGILIVTAYSITLPNAYYSYHLAVTAGILVFLSAISFTYFCGHTSVMSSS